MPYYQFYLTCIVCSETTVKVAVVCLTGRLTLLRGLIPLSYRRALSDGGLDGWAWSTLLPLLQRVPLNPAGKRLSSCFSAVKKIMLTSFDNLTITLHKLPDVLETNVLGNMFNILITLRHGALKGSK